MAKVLSQAIAVNFLGHSPNWFKLVILSFLVINPIVLMQLGPFITGWLFILEFIFTLAMALKCYPLQSGGLLALQGILLGLTSPDQVYHEITDNFQVILLLMFMVASIYFMKDLLMLTFNQILLKIENKIVLSQMFILVAALLSAFLDALTVTAVIISVGVGFYRVYYETTSGKHFRHENNEQATARQEQHLDCEELEQFRAFLRSILMQAVIGTALGGVCTLVGEPQNLLIAQHADWSFGEFFLRMAPVTMPVLACSLLMSYLLEKMSWFGYGAELPSNVRSVLLESAKSKRSKMTVNSRAAIGVQIIIALWLVFALAFHLAEVGLVGLSVIILLTSMNGITEEHAIGKAFEEAMPFTALLAVFFGIVAIIHDQDLFKPILDSVLASTGQAQITLFYLANGLLSMVSDNVFVATVYMNEVSQAFDKNILNREQFDMIAVAINAGTNLPSVATPNGQAAFLFLLTSSIAPLLRLSYGRMVWMALPFAIVMTLVGLLCVAFILPEATHWLLMQGWIPSHSPACLH